jgi:hypothetical protein
MIIDNKYAFFRRVALSVLAALTGVAAPGRGLYASLLFRTR